MEKFLKESNDLLKIFHFSSRIGNLLLIIQCSVFVWILYFSTFVVFQGRFSENSVDCVVDNEEEGGFLRAVNNWCLSYGLYKLPNVTHNVRTTSPQRLDYYFWFPYTLTAHALVMYLSGWIRKSKERGVMEKFLKYFITNGLLTVSPAATSNGVESNDDDKPKVNPFGAGILKDLEEMRKSEEEPKEEPCTTPELMNGTMLSTKPTEYNLIRTLRIRTVAKVLEQRIEEKINVDWTSSLICCEFLNLVIQISVGFYYNYLISGNYLRLGFSSWKNIDEIFPSLARCHFYHVGASGSIVMKDALCVLSQIYSYRIIFLVIWWSNVLFLICGISVLIFRLIESVFYKQEWYLRGVSFANRSVDVKVAKQIMYADYVFLKYLKDNIGEANFRMVLEHFTSYKKTTETEMASTYHYKFPQNRIVSCGTERQYIPHKKLITTSRLAVANRLVNLVLLCFLCEFSKCLYYYKKKFLKNFHHSVEQLA